MDNNHENLICPVCKTSNEQDYKFCKNCGSPLSAETRNETRGEQYTPPPNFGGNYGYNSQQGNYYNYYNRAPYTDYSAVEPTLEDVDTKKVQAYVGTAKQDYFMQLFIAMKRLGRKLFVSWPVAILGTLLATPFAAAWFFYRKMYKIGTIICLSCLLLTCITTALTYNSTVESLNEIIAETKDLSDQELMNYVVTDDDSESATYSYPALVTYIAQLLSLAGVLYLALNGNHLYYKHVTGKIKKSDSLYGPKDLFFYSMQGRPSAAAAVLIPFGFSTLCSLITFIPYFEIAISEISAQRLLVLLSLI